MTDQGQEPTSSRSEASSPTFTILQEGGYGWGKTRTATCVTSSFEWLDVFPPTDVAFIAVGRNSGSAPQLIVYPISADGLGTEVDYNTSLGGSVSAVAALGSESVLAVGINAGASSSSDKLFLFGVDSSLYTLQPLDSTGDNWSSYYATSAVKFGKIGNTIYLVVARERTDIFGKSNTKMMIYNVSPEGKFGTEYDLPLNWGASRYATALATSALGQSDSFYVAAGRARGTGGYLFVFQFNGKELIYSEQVGAGSTTYTSCGAVALGNDVGGRTSKRYVVAGYTRWEDFNLAPPGDPPKDQWIDEGDMIVIYEIQPTGLLFVTNHVASAAVVGLQWIPTDSGAIILAANNGTGTSAKIQSFSFNGSTLTENGGYTANWDHPCNGMTILQTDSTLGTQVTLTRDATANGRVIQMRADGL